jgi:hypothetical protein
VAREVHLPDSTASSAAAELAGSVRLFTQSA